MRGPGWGWSGGDAREGPCVLLPGVPRRWGPTFPTSLSEGRPRSRHVSGDGLMRSLVGCRTWYETPGMGMGARLTLGCPSQPDAWVPLAGEGGHTSC